MSGRSSKSVYPPEWWNESMYSFLNNMKRLDWIWEFYRRYRIGIWKPGYPVDAMNPANTAQQDGDENDPTGFLHKLYFHANHKDLPQIAGLPLMSKPPAVWSRDLYGWFLMKSMFPDGEDQAPKKLSAALAAMPNFTISVNLNRKDSEIIKDFKRILAVFREKHPQTPISRGKDKNWISNKILQTWDLRELGVTWTPIAKALDHKDISYARNAHKTANKYIRQLGWRDLLLTD